MESLAMEYLLFVGMGLYLVCSLMFLFLFLRTLRTRDGIGLTFLRVLTFSLSIGSFSVFAVRYLSIYHDLSLEIGRAVTIINPIAILGVGLYLNFLFHQKEQSTSSKDTKNILDIQRDVKIVKRDVKELSK